MTTIDATPTAQTSARTPRPSADPYAAELTARVDAMRAVATTNLAHPDRAAVARHFHNEARTLRALQRITANLDPIDAAAVTAPVAARVAAVREYLAARDERDALGAVARFAAAYGWRKAPRPTRAARALRVARRYRARVAELLAAAALRAAASPVVMVALYVVIVAELLAAGALGALYVAE